MSRQRQFRRIAERIWREDIKTVTIFLLLIMTLFFGYPLMMGYLVPLGLVFNTPSNDISVRAEFNDTDNDLLIDLIEETPKGVPVYNERDNSLIGRGTGTDPYDRDSDNDLFTDGTEDNLGSNPNSWIMPGFVWIIYLIAIALYILGRKQTPDRLKEYRDFEENRVSEGVAGKSGKYAYGSSSIFGKSVEEMSEEEKAEKVMSDPRVMRMMSEGNKEAPKLKNDRGVKIVQLIIVTLFVFAIRYIIIRF